MQGQIKYWITVQHVQEPGEEFSCPVFVCALQVYSGCSISEILGQVESIHNMVTKELEAV